MLFVNERGCLFLANKFVSILKDCLLLVKKNLLSGNSLLFRMASSFNIIIVFMNLSFFMESIILYVFSYEEKSIIGENNLCTDNSN